MTRVILFIIIAGNMMWGTMVVCGYAAVLNDSETKVMGHSDCEAPPYYVKGQKMFFYNYRGREDVSLSHLIAEGRVYAVGHRNSFLVADAYVCRTPKGDCKTASKSVGKNCYCSRSGDDGTVVKIPSVKPRNNGQESQNQTSSGDNESDKTSTTDQTTEESQD